MMQAVGPDTAEIKSQFEGVFPEPEGMPNVDMSNDFWDYRNRGKFFGVPVQQEAKNLLVDNMEELNKALQYRPNVKIWSGYISPQEQDKEYLQQYKNIKQAQAQGVVQVLQEQKQFCPSMNKFLVFVTYNEISVDLNPRFNHLKESING